MSGPELLRARLTRRVHPDLTIDVEFELRGGERGVIFGPSGAGKTSILRMIAGLDRPDSGLVRLGDETLFDSGRRVHVPLRSRRIGFIFQDDLLFPHMDVESNIRFGLRGRPRPEADARLIEVAALCGVGTLLARRPESLSGGERQRVGLARALAPQPRLLLCDEPISAIDQRGRDAMVERLIQVQRAEGFPLLYVTHAPAEAVALGQVAFLLAEGRIVDRGPPLDVLTASREGAAVRLEGVRNVFAAVVADHAPDGGETRVQLVGGPALIVPFNGLPVGDLLTVGVRADDVLLARGAIEGLSARNLIAGRVERVISHGGEAEVLVRTGSIVWIVSVVASAASALALEPGADVFIILKARSCQVV